VAAINNLPEREQYIMSMYYEQDMNLKEIAAVLDVTESRICQLHSQSIARLRANGETVTCVLPGHESEVNEFDCDRELALKAGQWVVQPRH
jgi:DNA-binding transcriptional regulator LsrR (DeoR family)